VKESSSGYWSGDELRSDSAYCCYFDIYK